MFVAAGLQGRAGLHVALVILPCVYRSRTGYPANPITIPASLVRSYLSHVPVSTWEPPSVALVRIGRKVKTSIIPPCFSLVHAFLLRHQPPQRQPLLSPSLLLPLPRPPRTASFLPQPRSLFGRVSPPLSLSVLFSFLLLLIGRQVQVQVQVQVRPATCSLLPPSLQTTNYPAKRRRQGRQHSVCLYHILRVRPLSSSAPLRRQIPQIPVQYLIIFFLCFGHPCTDTLVPTLWAKTAI